MLPSVVPYTIAPQRSRLCHRFLRSPPLLSQSASSLPDGGEQKETTSSQTAGWSGDHLWRTAKKRCSNTAANSGTGGGHKTRDAGCCRHGCVTLWTRQTKRGGGGGRREWGDGKGGCVGCGGRTEHSDTSLMNILKGPLL